MKEIESALRALPGVLDASLTFETGVRGGRHTVAYLVPAPGSDLRTEDVRRHLSGQFSEDRLPGDIVIVSELPLPRDSGVVSPRAPEQTRTVIEDIVVGICGAAYGREPVDLHEPLFDSCEPAHCLEGVLDQVRGAFKIDLSMECLRGARTPASLAQAIEFALRDGGGDAPSQLSGAEGGRNFPLSSAQQRMWFLNQLDPGDYSYHLPVFTRLRGPLDATALEQCFIEVAGRHRELQRHFPRLDEQPAPASSGDFDWSLPLVDLGHLPESEREPEAIRLAEAEARRGFNLASESAWRAQLIRLDARDHLLTVTLHQIVADPDSVRLLLGELQSCYGRLAGGMTRQRSWPAAVDYADYAAWERQWLRGKDAGRQLAFWQQQLEDSPPVLDLPFDRPRPAALNPDGASQWCHLPDHLLLKLQVLGRDEGASLFMSLTAGFHALLHRYTGARDMLVGMPASRRWRSDFRELIGPLTNTLILRTRLHPSATFRELLRQVRATTCAAARHQDLPFARLVEALHPDRTPGHAPLFQVMIEHVPGDPEVLHLPGLDGSAVAGALAAINFDLKLTVVHAKSSTKVFLRYNPALFDGATIRRMLECWQTMLESAVADPDCRLSDLAWLPESDRRQLLESWNGGGVSSPSAESLMRLFEQEVARHPNDPAVVYENTQLSYRELNARANQLAGHLCTLGVGPDVLVGLSVERSLDMAVGLLGILKAGGAYVPLDPDYPQERLTFILQDSAPQVVLTQTRLKHLLSATSGHIVCLDGDRETIAAKDPGNPVERAHPENLAYVIYTSGSTGQPKGVLVTRRGLLNLVQAITRRYVLRSDDRILQFSTLNFDIAAEEIFPTWLCGATLVLRRDSSPPALPEFLRFIARRRLTVLNLPTAFWHEWVRHLSESGVAIPSSIRLVVIGGEQASPVACAKWRALAGDRVRWLNSYGPTEATVTASVYEPARPDSPEGIPAPVPIGRPIDDTEVLVLDAGLRLVPVGVAGELYIGGAGVARGYLNRPDLTAEKFVPHPFRPNTTSRLYKTGDRVRFLPDGNLQFLGRLDQQVKVRGYRIEPGEIETILGRHPEVKQAVVKVWEREPDQKHLVAYVVLGSDSRVQIGDLRSFLTSRLPAPLVPTYLRRLEELPLTANGKIDYRALPAPDPELEAGNESAMARDRLEFQLVQIWRDVLRLSQIGIRDNFFDLGGHSLMAVRMFTQIERLVGRPVPIATLFQAPTVEQLAAILRNEGWQPARTSLVAIQPRGSKTPFFCVHGGGGGVLWYSDLARHLDPDQPFYGLQAPGFDAEREPLDDIRALASLYLDEIRTVQPQGPYLLGGASMGGAVVYEMAQQLLAQGQPAALLALLDTPRPVAISRLRHRLNGCWDRFRHEVFERMAFHHRELSQRNLREKVEYVKVRFRRTAEESDITQTGPSGSLIGLQHLGPARQKVHAANALALSLYSPQPYPGHLTLFVATDGEPESFMDPDLGWNGWVAGLERHVVPGDHNSMMREPHVRKLAAKLSRCLDRAQGVRAVLTTLFALATECPCGFASLAQSLLST